MCVDILSSRAQTNSSLEFSTIPPLSDTPLINLQAERPRSQLSLQSGVESARGEYSQDAFPVDGRQEDVARRTSNRLNLY